MKEALGSSETSVLTMATRRNVPEDTILRTICAPCLHSHWLEFWRLIAIVRPALTSLVFDVPLSELVATSHCFRSNQLNH
jgi:hypothetical protein